MKFEPPRSIAGGFWGAVSLVVIWIVQKVTGEQLDGMMAGAIGVIVSTLGSELVPKRKSTEAPE